MKLVRPSLDLIESHFFSFLMLNSVNLIVGKRNLPTTSTTTYFSFQFLTGIHRSNFTTFKIELGIIAKKIKLYRANKLDSIRNSMEPISMNLPHTISFKRMEEFANSNISKMLNSKPLPSTPPEHQYANL